MAYSKYSPSADRHYMADTVADLVDLPWHSMGDTCYVIENGKTYHVNSKHEWICGEDKVDSNAQETLDLSNYVTKDEIADFIKADALAGVVTEDTLAQYVTADALAKHSASKYEIRNCPEACSIDYRDKEIRIFCHEDAEYKLQNVGEGGNPNMYYMTFRSYAPEGAAYLKEGDKGTIIDEVISLTDGTGTGVDKFGRKYKDHWFALAMYNADNDTWTYFGNNSNADKYLGWTYVVEWYDENDKMINTDAVRINLSNRNCHNLLAHYYG